jgi:hypothetical protein
MLSSALGNLPEVGPCNTRLPCSVPCLACQGDCADITSPEASASHPIPLSPSLLHFLGASFAHELLDPVKDSVFAGEAVSEIPAAEELIKIFVVGLVTET